MKRSLFRKNPNNDLKLYFCKHEFLWGITVAINYNLSTSYYHDDE